MLGSLMIGSGYLSNHPDAGHKLGLYSSITVAGVGGWRYAVTRAPMPGLPLIALGGLATIYHGGVLPHRFSHSWIAQCIVVHSQCAGYYFYNRV